MIVGIDASRIRSGGGVAHLIGILCPVELQRNGITEVHVWSHDSLLNQLPEIEQLRKHCPRMLQKSLFSQLLWQLLFLSGALRQNSCDLLFTLDASSLCLYKNNVVLSQDMQSFEPGIISLYKPGLAKLRLQVIYFLQKWALKRAKKAIFLTDYSLRTVQQHTGVLDASVINHGVHSDFVHPDEARQSECNEQSIKSVYISNFVEYKHQVEVLSAVKMLREENIPISIDLVGAVENTPYATQVMSLVERLDPSGSYITVHGHVEHSRLPNFLSKRDIFIFASSCENMPVTLLEGMSSGLPVVCSNRGPMPEILGHAGLYFDPVDPGSIKDALSELVTNAEMRLSLGESSHSRASNYTWDRCARETWSLLASMDVT